MQLFQQVMTRKLLALFFSVGMFACEDVPSTSSQPPLRIYRETFLSKPFVVDQIYRSMLGPMATYDFKDEANAKLQFCYTINRSL